MALKLHTARYDRLLARDSLLPARIAASLGCSESCIKILRWRSGRGEYGARRDGQERVRAVNNFLRAAEAGGKK